MSEVTASEQNAEISVKEESVAPTVNEQNNGIGNGGLTEEELIISTSGDGVFGAVAGK